MTNDTSAQADQLGRLEITLELLTNGVLMDPPELEDLLMESGIPKDAQAHLEKDLTAARFLGKHLWDRSSNVVGMGIALRETKGHAGRDLSLKVYVNKKQPKAALDASNFIPPVLNLPGVGSVSTDVEEIGPVGLETFRGRRRPAIGGYSIGHSNGTAGTLGCLVRQRHSPHKTFILSNSHVLANSGSCSVGDAVLQPGPADGGRSGQDEVAVVEVWVPLDFSGAFVNRMDAAMAGPVVKQNCQSEIAVLASAPAGIQPKITVGMTVQKVGRTTGHTCGSVIDIRFRTRLSYQGGLAGFVDLALCTRYTSRGDSGSLVLDEDRMAVGLHMGGSLSTSFFCPIQPVLDVLDVDIVTQPLA